MIPGIYTNVNNIINETYTINSNTVPASNKIQVTGNSYAYNTNGYPVSKNGNVSYIYK